MAPFCCSASVQPNGLRLSKKKTSLKELNVTSYYLGDVCIHSVCTHMTLMHRNLIIAHHPFLQVQLLLSALALRSRSAIFEAVFADREAEALSFLELS